MVFSKMYDKSLLVFPLPEVLWSPIWLSQKRLQTSANAEAKQGGKGLRWFRRHGLKCPWVKNLLQLPLPAAQGFWNVARPNGGEKVEAKCGSGLSIWSSRQSLWGSLMAPWMERRWVKRFRFISGNVWEDFSTLHQFTRIKDKSTLSTRPLRLGMLGNASRKTNQSPSCPSGLRGWFLNPRPIKTWL